MKKLAYLINDRLRALESIAGKRKIVDSTQPSHSKKSTKAKVGAPGTTLRVQPRQSDSAILHLVSEFNGKQICLRNLSVRGCFSKDPVKCTAEDRTHHVPTEPLPAAVVKHMTDKWGGVSPKFPQLLQ